MKTKYIITGCCALFVAAILTSCSTSVEIAKRQFNDGYYIHIARKNNAAPETIASNKETTKAVTEEPIVVQVAVEQASAPVVKEEVQNQEIVSASRESAPVVSENRHKETAVTTVAPVEETTAKVSQGDNFHKKLTPRDIRRAMRGDAPAIVLILLCIFLPFIAVGIVDDWGTKFWFDILLCLLFWLPGVIYAFFVCFG